MRSRASFRIKEQNRNRAAFRKCNSLWGPPLMDSVDRGAGKEAKLLRRPGASGDIAASADGYGRGKRSPVRLQEPARRPLVVCRPHHRRRQKGVGLDRGGPMGSQREVRQKRGGRPKARSRQAGEISGLFGRTDSSQRGRRPLQVAWRPHGRPSRLGSPVPAAADLTATGALMEGDQSKEGLVRTRGASGSVSCQPTNRDGSAEAP